MKTVLNMVLICLAAPCVICCQTAGDPIPVKWLHDGHLVVPEFNFSVESPSTNSPGQAVVDWRYIRHGGVKATRSAKVGVLAAPGLCVAFLVFLGTHDASAESLGSLTAVLSTLIFSIWEFARWRVRRKNPVWKPASTAG